MHAMLVEKVPWIKRSSDSFETRLTPTWFGTDLNELNEYVDDFTRDETECQWRQLASTLDDLRFTSLRNL